MSKTLILSDIHFCKWSTSVESIDQLQPLWQGCDELVLNGDTSEMHSAGHAAQSNEMTNALVEVASNDNVKTTLICGNHDPAISDVEHMWFCDKKILVFHGHASFKSIAPWSWRSKYIARSRDAHLGSSGNGLEEQLSAVRSASIKAATGEFSTHRPNPLHMMMLGPAAVFHILSGWKRFPSLTARWADKFAPSASFIITGHTHHAGIWNRGGRTIINTGSFGFPSHPRAVLIDGKSIVVYKIVKQDDRFKLGSVLQSWDAL
jgi:predicted phosphodiesterase